MHTITSAALQRTQSIVELQICKPIEFSEEIIFISFRCNFQRATTLGPLGKIVFRRGKAAKPSANTGMQPTPVYRCNHDRPALL